MFATALLIALAGVSPLDDDQAIATAEASAPAAAAQDVEPTQRGVIPYAPDFFAAAQPSTALDMITRLPGFSLEQGDNVRGFAGAAGNVLIDGRRLASKYESYALMQVSSAPHVVASGGNREQARTDFVTYLKTTSALIKSEFAHNAKVEVNRFKGLGEMNASQLKETTMDPAKRTLLRVEIVGDRKATGEAVNALMGSKPEARFRFIQERAAFAKDLDI